MAGWEHVCNELILARAEVDATNFKYPHEGLSTPMHVAVGRGHPGVVFLLLEARASIQAMDNRNQTPRTACSPEPRHLIII